jgi:hypothetical protein
MNKFNRILLTSGLAATASLVANSAAFAGTTGEISLSGTVASNLTMTLTPLDPASALPLGLGNTYTVKIGVVGASTNSANGLRVVLNSDDWALKSGSNSIAITSIADAPGIGVAATTKSLANPTVNNNYVLANTFTSGPRDPGTSSIYIGYSVSSTQATGTYTGTVRFTAVDN